VAILAIPAADSAFFAGFWKDFGLDFIGFGLFGPWHVLCLILRTRIIEHENCTGTEDLGI